MISYILATKQWWTTWGTLPVINWVKAARLYKAGQFTLAGTLYEKGLVKYPDHPASNCARIDLAYCLFRQQKFENSEKQLRTVISLLPGAREAYQRLAKLHMWTGNYLEAAWIYRRAIQNHPGDIEFISGFLLSVLENGGPGYLMQEAKSFLVSLSANELQYPRIMVARAMLALRDKDNEESLKILEDVICKKRVPLEAYLTLSDLLLSEGKVANARRYLRIAMNASPNNPRVLTLFSKTYLQPGPFYNPSFGRQLATTAAQNTAWLSPRAMHTLAESYQHEGDKMAALIMASKAKEVGNQRLGSYREQKVLDRLIETLSTGTLA